MNTQTEAVSQHTPVDLDFVKEALRIINTGKDSKGNSFNNLGKLNQAAFIGERSGALIAEIEHLRTVNADLLAACVTFSVWLMSPDLSKETIAKMRATARAAIAKARV